MTKEKLSHLMAHEEAEPVEVFLNPIINFPPGLVWQNVTEEIHKHHQSERIIYKIIC